MRELAALFATSTSTAHRVVVAMTSRLAAAAAGVSRDRRVVDGTLIPTRDHRRAAKSKSYRWSCNAQILIRRCDLVVIATTTGGPGNRNDPVHYRGSAVQAWCERHGRVLADGGYRGVPELVTPRFRGNRIVRDHRWRASATPCPGRACDCQTQELARASRSPTARPPSGYHAQRRRFPTQPPGRITGQPLDGW